MTYEHPKPGVEHEEEKDAGKILEESGGEKLEDVVG